MIHTTSDFKNNYYEIKHKGAFFLPIVIIFLSLFIFLFFVTTIFNWPDVDLIKNIGILIMCFVICLPVWFIPYKLKVDNDEILVIMTTGIRYKVKIGDVKKVVIRKPKDIYEGKIDYPTKVILYSNKPKFYVDSLMEHYDEFCKLIETNISESKIEYDLLDIYSTKFEEKK